MFTHIVVAFVSIVVTLLASNYFHHRFNKESVKDNFTLIEEAKTSGFEEGWRAAVAHYYNVIKTIEEQRT